MTVIYDPSVHRSVFFTLHGSVWPDVIGWCILNCCITYVVWTLKHNYDYDITFASTGHDLLSLLISFLVVSHVSTAYGRFWEARAYLGTIFSACRKLSQKVAIYTMDSVDKEAAKQYRLSIETWLLELMHTAMNVIEDEKQALFFAEGTCIESISGTIMMPTTTTDTTTTADEQQSDETKKILNKRLLGNVQSFRYQQDPMEVAGMLQAAIMSHEQVLKSQKLIRFELELLGCVNTFIDNYLQLLKFVTTPIPFPLVQMGRTTLFIWIFTLSGVLVHNVYDLLPNLVVIFFITYGFVGLMYVSIELHDPFGKDPNDFEIGRYTNVTALGIKEDLSEEGTRRFQRAAESHKHHHHRHGSTGNHSHIHDNNKEEEDQPSLIKLDDDNNNNNMSDDALTQIHGNSTIGGRKRKGCSTDSGEESDNSSDSLIARTTYKSIAPYVASLSNSEHYGGTPNSTGGRRSAAATARRATHRKALSDAFATVSSFSLRGVLGGGNHAGASSALNKPTGRKQRSSSYGYGSSASTTDDYGGGSASARRLETTNWGALDENDEEGNTNDNTNIQTSLLP